jgi:uncharacterized phage-associated protein
MATHVWDVAQYILKHKGSMTATKLEKLCYYSQAWHLVWDEEPLFPEPIQAWANGPVAPALYARHRLEYMVDDVGGDPAALTQEQAETVDMVLEFYGPKTGAELSDLTHREAPWRDARGDISPGARSQALITHASMAEYYESLLGTSADG